MPVAKKVLNFRTLTPELRAEREKFHVDMFVPGDWIPKEGDMVTGRMTLHGPWITGRFCGLFVMNSGASKHLGPEVPVVESKDGLRYVLHDLWPAICCTKCGAELDLRVHNDWLDSVSSVEVAFGPD